MRTASRPAAFALSVLAVFAVISAPPAVRASFSSSFSEAASALFAPADLDPAADVRARLEKRGIEATVHILKGFKQGADRGLATIRRVTGFTDTALNAEASVSKNLERLPKITKNAFKAEASVSKKLKRLPKITKTALKEDPSVSKKLLRLPKITRTGPTPQPKALSSEEQLASVAVKGTIPEGLQRSASAGLPRKLELVRKIPRKRPAGTPVPSKPTTVHGISPEELQLRLKESQRLKPPRPPLAKPAPELLATKFGAAGKSPELEQVAGRLSEPNAGTAGEISLSRFPKPSAPKPGEISLSRFPEPGTPKPGEISLSRFPEPGAPKLGEISLSRFPEPGTPKLGGISLSRFREPSAPNPGEISLSRFPKPGTEKLGPKPPADRLPKTAGSDDFAANGIATFHDPETAKFLLKPFGGLFDPKPGKFGPNPFTRLPDPPPGTF